MAQTKRYFRKDPHRVKDSYYYMVNNVPFARVYKVSENRRKGNHCWSYDLADLPVECFTIYKSRKEVTRLLDGFIDSFNKYQ